MSIYNKIIICISILTIAILCVLAFVPDSVDAKIKYEGEISENTEPYKININTAGVKELIRCDGIGEKTAEKIIAHREKYGPFKKIAQLTKIEGLSKSWLKNYEDILTVE